MMVAIGLVAAALRLASCLDGFWLDEIWSWSIARQVASPLEVFTRHPIDNNHPLNTLVLWALGDLLAWPIYRLPVAFCGIAAVYLGWLWAKPRGKLAQVSTAVALAVAYPMVLYGSEARGYGYAACFGMALLVAGDDRAARSRWWLIGYNVAAVLGVLAHLTFVPLLAASAAWTGLRLLWRERRWGTWIGMHAIPAVFLGVFWFGFARHIEIGGGPQVDAWELLRQTTRLLAYPLGPDGAVAILLLALVAFAMVGLFRRRDDRTALFALGLLLPVLAAAWQVVRAGEAGPPPLFSRYFLLPVMLAVLLLAEQWAHEAARSRGVRFASAVITGVLFLGLNVWADVRQIQIGRVGWPAAIDLINRATPPGQPISLAGDHDFRTQVEASFYARRVGRPLRYVSLDRQAEQDLPEWIVVHERERDPAPLQSLGRGALRYEAVGRFPGYGPSGTGLVLYRRAADAQ